MNPFDLRDDRVSKDHTLAILDNFRERNMAIIKRHHREMEVNMHRMVDQFFEAAHRLSEIEEEMHATVETFFEMARGRIENIFS